MDGCNCVYAAAIAQTHEHFDLGTARSTIAECARKRRESSRRQFERLNHRINSILYGGHNEETEMRRSPQLEPIVGND